MALSVVPQLLTDASSDLSNIGATLDEARALTAVPTTAILPAGADEVSMAVTALFNGHGQGFQTMAGQAAGFHQQFVTTLAQAANSYQSTEQAIGQTLRSDFTQFEQLVTGVSTPVQPPIPNSVNPITLVVAGTDNPVATPLELSIAKSVYNLSNPYAVFTPEQFFPATPQLGALTLDQSVLQGQQLLNTAIMTQLGLGHTVTVVGVSQGAIVETLEIRHLMAAGSPGVGQLSFILAGDPNNPDGGFFARFPGFHIPFLGVTSSGATPPNSPYPTTIYTNQYDGVSNFPQYPLNVVSDTNAVFGFLFGQHYYHFPVGAYTQLPTSPGYTGSTQYFELLDPTLPLVQPLRLYVPQPYGNAFADLLQPDLRVIVDMGYANEGYANVTTPASIFNLPNVPVIARDLAIGTVQGPEAFLHDLGFPVNAPTGYPFDPVLDPNLHVG